MGKLVTNYFYDMEDEFLWFVSYLTHTLCCFSLREKKIEILIPLEAEICQEFAYSNLVVLENEVYIIPSNEKRLCIYNKENRTIQYVEVYENAKYNKYMYCCTEGKYIYCFPGNADRILRIDTNSKEIEYLEIWRENTFDSPIVKLQSCVKRQKDKVYFLLSQSNEMIVYNLKTESSSLVKIGLQEDRYSAFEFLDDNIICLAKETGEFLIYNFSNNSVVDIIRGKIAGFVAHRSDSARAVFSDMIVCQNIVYVFPAQANKIIRINIENKHVEDASHLFGESFGESKCELTSTIFRKDESIYGFRTDLSIFFSLNLFNNKYEEYEINTQMSMRKNISILHKDMNENIEYELRDFIEGIIDNEKSDCFSVC